MKRITHFYVLMLIYLIGISSEAQIASYTFTNQIGTFTPNSPLATSVDIITDEKVSSKLPIGFDFTFGTSTYSQFYMSSNGFLSFGPVGLSLSTNNLSTANSSQRPIIAPLWDDLKGITSTSKASYELVGTAPNRVLTIEWLNWGWHYSATQPTISFQVKLYEATNVIEFVYRQESSAINGSATASIGINDALGSGSGTYLNLNSNLLIPTVTSTTPVTTINTKPSNNQIFKFTPPTCLYTGALSVTNMNVPTATLNLSVPASVNIDFYVTNGTIPSTSSIPTGTIVTGGTSLALSGLIPSAIYTIFVKYSCPAIGSDWAQALTFKTPCSGVFTNNFFENFDNSVVGNSSDTTHPHCWNTIDNISTTGYGYVQNSTNYSQSGDQSYLLYRSNSLGNLNQDLVLVSPETSRLGNGVKQLRFSVRNYGTSYINKLEVITLTNNTSAVGATVLTTIYPTHTNFQEYIIPLPQNTNDYFGFRLAHNGTTSTSYIAIDDIYYEDMLPCIFPTNITVNNITTNSATISWSPSVSTNVTGYEYEIRKSGEAGSGTTGLVKNGNTIGTSENIIGLDHSTKYTVHVRSKCGATNGTWSSIPIKFETTCATYINNFFEDFESSDIGASNIATYPYCWSYIKTTGYGYVQGSSSYSQSGTQSFSLYRTNSNTNTNKSQEVVLVSPETDKLGNGSKQLRFSVRSYSSSFINKLEIISLDNNSSTANAKVLTTIYPDHTTFQEYIIPLPQTTDNYFGFRLAHNGLTTSSQILIDDIYYEDILPCIFPININVSNITTNSATISWDLSLANNTTGYEYEIRTHGSPGSGYVGLIKNAITTQTSVNISDLIACSNYTVYVRTICGSSHGDWNPTAQTIVTPTGIKDGDFFEGFENTPSSLTSSNITYPYCWSYLSTLSTTNGYGYTRNSAANNGNNGFYAYRSSITNGDVLLISPETNSLGNGTKQLRFSAKVTSTSYVKNQKLEIYSMNGTTTTASKTLIQGNFPLTTEWQEFTVRLPQTSDNYFAFSFNSNGGSYYIYLDDIYYEEIPLHVLDITKSDNTCHGDNTGSAYVVVSGGLAPFTYLWSPTGGNTDNAKNLSAGNYTVIVRDKYNREITGSVMITAPDILLSGLAYTNINCSASKNGFASINPSGGTPPYTVLWSTGETTNSVFNLNKGQHSVTITDSKGCVLTESFNITEPPLLITSIGSQINVSNYQGNDGSVSVNVTGGTAPYSYNWLLLSETTDTASNLSAGSYTVEVTDANGCTTTQTFIVTQPPGPIEIKLLMKNDATCKGLNNGSLSVDVTGGTPPFSYSWSPIGGNLNEAKNLPAGTYTIYITDSVGKSSSKNFIITEPISLISHINSKTDVGCYGQNNGTATVVVSGGTGPYTYQWSNGESTQTANNLFGGNNFVTITDTNGCSHTENFIINEPLILTSKINQTNVSSFQGSDGSATISPIGGTAPYTFVWFPSGETTNTVSNLTAGSYSVTITDSKGCSENKTVLITQPPAAITISTVFIDNVSCKGLNDGSITINISGGTPPYSYKWSSSSSSSRTATNLIAGTYNVLITDSLGDFVNGTYVITEPEILTVNLNSIKDVTCYSLNNGSSSVSVTGGTPPYTYLWSNGENTHPM